jgi:hypothetical protein
MEFTTFQELFMLEYCKDWNGSRAYSAAKGVRGEYDRHEASKLLQNPTIKAEIEKRKKAITDKVQLQVEDVVRDIKNVLNADARDLIEYRVGACRHCYGLGFLYQSTPQEFRNAYLRHADSKEGREGKLFDGQGGEGFNPKRDPNPECPECFGDGVGYTMAHDTRMLTPEAAALYTGTKPTNNGLEILMRSKDKAREQAAQYLGMNKLDLTMTHSIKAKDLTDDELANIAKGDAA